MNKANSGVKESPSKESLLKVNPALKYPAVLVGKWTIELSFPTDPSNKFF